MIIPSQNKCFREYTVISLSVCLSVRVSVCVQNTTFCLVDTVGTVRRILFDFTGVMQIFELEKILGIKKCISNIITGSDFVKRIEVTRQTGYNRSAASTSKPGDRIQKDAKNSPELCNVMSFL